MMEDTFQRIRVYAEPLLLDRRSTEIVVAVAAVLTLFLLVRKFLFYLTWRSFRDTAYTVGHHQWRPGKIAGPQWCNLCESVVYGIRSYVVTCDICGKFAHAQCAASSLKYAGSANIPASCACKTAAITTPSLPSEEQSHVWIKGNIDPMDSCALCGLFCGSILALSGLKCAWCHVRVHEACFLSHEHKRQAKHDDPNHRPSQRYAWLDHCDFGPHANLILPPSSIILRPSPPLSSKLQPALSSVKSVAKKAVHTVASIRLRRISSSELIEDSTEDVTTVETEVEKIDSHDRPFDIELPSSNLTPLLVFINSKSGGKMGLHVLRQLRQWLNPLQIYDLAHQDPKVTLDHFRHVPRLRLLVCGGDGTIGWVLGALDELNLPRQPPIAVLPLGTGNDLARTLGWGSGYPARGISSLLSEVEEAYVSLLDRWQTMIGGVKGSVLNNYLGVGVDAQVALEFHERRQRSPSLFMSQFVNKLWYSQYGAKHFLVRKCANLARKMDLICDGDRIELPEGTEGVIVLNINSYGGGSKLWHDASESDNDSESSDDDLEDSNDETEDGSDLSDNEKPQSPLPRRRGSSRVPTLGASSPHDGLLDVVAVYGTLHLGQMQVGLSRAVRLCQAKSVKLVLQETLPMQVDGEPWQQSPTTVEVSYLNQAFMLSRAVKERDLVTREVGEVLDWAEHSKVISASQRDILLAEMTRRVARGQPRRTTAHRQSLRALSWSDS